MYFSSLSFCISMPPSIATVSPKRLYRIVTFSPNIAGNIYSDASFIRGELIRNVNVTPSGIPAPMNPIKSGIDEQEQNGVTIPRSAAIK